MCYLVHGVATIFHHRQMLTSSGNLFLNMSDAQEAYFRKNFQILLAFIVITFDTFCTRSIGYSNKISERRKHCSLKPPTFTVSTLTSNSNHTDTDSWTGNQHQH